MIDTIIAAISGFVQQNNNPLGMLVLGASALLEYVFPPFPGDTVTLFGAFLVVRYDWSMPLVFGVVMLGSALGALAHVGVGRLIGAKYNTGWLQRKPTTRRAIEHVLAAFQRWGTIYVLINRFLPGIRGVIFIAAGMARLKVVPVFIYAMVSAAIWNAAILALGYSLGANWLAIRKAVSTYTYVAYVAIATIAALATARWWWRRRKYRV